MKETFRKIIGVVNIALLVLTVVLAVKYGSALCLRKDAHEPVLYNQGTVEQLIQTHNAYNATHSPDWKLQIAGIVKMRYRYVDKGALTPELRQFVEECAKAPDYGSHR